MKGRMDTDGELAVIKQQLKEINEKLTTFIEMNEKNHEKMVEKIEFEPIKKIVYGLVGAVMLSVLGAILTLVVSNKI